MGEARRYFVNGRVQAVGFRWFVLHEARALGLGGFVRNLADGRVEVLATGPGKRLDQLRALLEQGPGGARVESVTEKGAAEPGETYRREFVVEY